MAIDVLPQFIKDNYEVHEWKHACAILKEDFPSEFDDIIAVLSNFRLKKAYIDKSGGNKSLVSSDIDRAFTQRGWHEVKFRTMVSLQPVIRRVNPMQKGRAKILEEPIEPINYESPTHNVDCYKNQIALEIEWNNKDPFFDRDLNNFRLLFDLRAASVGVIITRCDNLQDIFNALGRGTSYGESTTHMSKLLPRIEGGGGGGCPILVVGIKKELFTDDDVVDPEIEQFATEQAIAGANETEGY